MIFFTIYTIYYIYLEISIFAIYTFQNTIYTSSFLLYIPSKKFPPAAGRYIYHILYIPQNLDFCYIHFSNIYVYTIYTATLVCCDQTFGCSFFKAQIDRVYDNFKTNFSSQKNMMKSQNYDGNNIGIFSPKFPGFIIILKYSNPQPLFIYFPYVCQQLPSPLNGIFFIIITK